MKKSEIKALLIEEKTKDPESEAQVNYLLGQLDIMSEEELGSMLKKANINEENIKDFLLRKIIELKKQFESKEHFINVNKFFCYGRDENTIHMHLIPKSLRKLKAKLGDEDFYKYFKNQLEDFLSRLQDILKKDSSIKLLTAVSTIFFNPNIASIHEQLGFDKITEIDLNNNQDEMSIEKKRFFLEMFNKDGENSRRVYYTQMSREKILESEFARIPNNEKAIVEG